MTCDGLEMLRKLNLLQLSNDIKKSPQEDSVMPDQHRYRQFETPADTPAETVTRHERVAQWREHLSRQKVLRFL